MAYRSFMCHRITEISKNANVLSLYIYIIYFFFLNTKNTKNQNSSNSVIYKLKF